MHKVLASMIALGICAMFTGCRDAQVLDQNGQPALGDDGKPRKAYVFYNDCHPERSELASAVEGPSGRRQPNTD